MNYTIRKGDSLWKIAQEVYGDGSRFMEIAEANDIADPDRIKPGTVIVLPGVADVPLPRPKPSSLETAMAPPFPYRPFRQGEFIENGDGSRSTERLRTVRIGGDWVNVPSLWMGPGKHTDLAKMTDDQLAALAQKYEQASGQRFRRWASLIEAELAARKRSDSGGNTSPYSNDAMPSQGMIGSPEAQPSLQPEPYTPDLSALMQSPEARPSMRPGASDPSFSARFGEHPQGLMQSPDMILQWALNHAAAERAATIPGGTSGVSAATGLPSNPNPGAGADPLGNLLRILGGGFVTPSHAGPLK